MNMTPLYVLLAMTSAIGFARAEGPSAAPAAPAAPPAIEVRVERLAIGTAIDNKEISGEASQFPGNVTRVYAWIKVSADEVPATIKHVWSADGKQEAEVPLEIKYTTMRTWSSKNVWPGSWKVDVVDQGGKVLATQAFTVLSEAAAPAQPQ